MRKNNYNDDKNNNDNFFFFISVEKQKLIPPSRIFFSIPVDGAESQRDKKQE